MEIVILTSIVVTLFLVFGITIYRELDKEYDPRTKEMGPRANMVNFIGRLFDDRQTAGEQVTILTAMTRTISDMEGDGVYFPDSVKAELEKKREELYCEYSNLPSVKSYANQ
jgi:hypothetical protein